MYTRLEAVSRWLEWSGTKHRDNHLLLERLAGDHPVAPLRILADASEALGIEGRREARHYTSLVPLNRFVDAVPPESELVRRMEREAAAPTAAFRATLTDWASAETRLRPLLLNNALLAEIAPLAANLTAAATIGLRALQFLESGQAAPPGWIDEQNRELDRLEKPVAEVRLAAVRPIRVLLARLKSQPLANIDVRSGNKPLCNGAKTVPNWTSRAQTAQDFVAKGSLYENEG